ncbi:MAG: DNA-3-methyladenine glycosylase 2 family protein [Azospirillaceae bacterium]|nr:DNA-3-methyladenine glycosylase 2 family protein [Azospirillaceae bacterium]
MVRPAGFPGLLRIILDQQISTRAADALWLRLAAVLDPIDASGFLVQSDETLRACGFSRQKIVYARGLASAIVEGRIDLDRVMTLDDDAAAATLIQLKGIGRWTAAIYLLSQGRPDIWPVDDLALQIGVQWALGLPERPTPAALLACAEPWRPYRSTAARLIWKFYIATVAAQRQQRRDAAAD